MLGLLGWGRARQRPKFNAPMLSTDSVLYPQPMVTGTFTRASAQYITDFEGITKKVESGSVAVEGSRVVTNLLTYSEDLSNAAWAIGGTASKSANNVINLPAEVDRCQQPVSGITVGSTYRLTVTLSGSGTVSLSVIIPGGPNVSKQVTLSSTPQRYTLSTTVTTSSASSGSFYPVYRKTGDTATFVTIHSAQLENVTGQTNQNPGEYVKTTSVAVTKCFATTNGNTVDANGVVTEATGTSLPTSYSERQNSTAYVLGDKIQVSGWWYNCTTAGTSASSAPTFPQGKAGTQTVTDGSVVWTIGGRLLLGYVSEPASTNKVTAYGIIPADTLGSELSSGSLTIGQKYQITARTDANFVADGAADNVVGTQFVATAATVTLDAGDKVKRVQWGVGEKSYHNGSSFVQNISGLTLSGATAAVLSIVTDETEIEKAGLAGINPGFKVYKLDNSAGSTYAYVGIAGTVGNLNPHTSSVFAKGGRGEIGLLGLLRTNIPASSSYRRCIDLNITPDTTARTSIVLVDPGKTVYFLLPQLEELPYTTSIMPTAGATATRAATSLSYLTAGNLRGNDVTVGVEWTPNLSWYTGHNHYIMSTGADSSNHTVFQMYSSYWKFRKIISSTEYGSSVNGTFAVGTTYKILGRSASTGVTSYLNGTKGSSETNGASASLGTYVYPGSDYAGGSASPMYLRNLRIWFKPLSDDRCKSLTQ